MRKIMCLLIIASVAIVPEYIMHGNAQNSYEYYRKKRLKKVTRDKPLSEIRASDREDFLDDLRGAVRDEIDNSISKERKASKRRINKNKLINEVRDIVRQEIEDAIKVREKRYLKKGTFEVGGFLSFQSKGLEADEADNNYRLRIFPVAAYFLGSNIALAFKGEADINISQSTQDYTAGLGPQFVFGLDKADEICFFATIFGGVSMRASDDKLGYRYGNEIGLKFVLTSGVILNTSVMVIFDNGGQNVEGFQNVLVPAIGITAWF